jgi:hypothetical protein
MRTNLIQLCQISLYHTKGLNELCTIETQFRNMRLHTQKHQLQGAYTLDTGW